MTKVPAPCGRSIVVIPLKECNKEIVEALWRGWPRVNTYIMLGRCGCCGGRGR